MTHKPLAICGVLALLGSGCMPSHITVTLPPNVPPTALLPSVLPPGPLLKLPDSQIPHFEDDSDTASLRTAAYQSLLYYQTLPANQIVTLSSDTYTVQDLAGSLQHLIDLVDHSTSRSQLQQAISQDFTVYQSTGSNSEQTVTFSAYYEPSIPARLHRTETYRYPIYGRPSDLVDVDIGQFNPKYQGVRISGRQEGKNLIPYYSREDIDSRKVLRHQDIAIAWAKDPLDIFFLQIEGSGWLDVGPDRHPIRIRYDGDNGLPYRSVGLYLIDHGLVGKDLTHTGFQRFMSRHPKERQQWLNQDPRYVFFRVDTSTAAAFAYGNIDVPLTPGRSVAADPRLFPKGALAWIETIQPVFNAEGVEISTAPLHRFVCVQDEGGAIQGPARIDFFAGHGRPAELLATHFWVPGKLYFLVRKKITS